jgi:hypothetical protein
MQTTLTILSGDELKSQRHRLWKALSDASLDYLAKGEIKHACDLAVTALKTIQTTDESSIKVEGEETHVDQFRELIAKAYGSQNDSE